MKRLLLHKGHFQFKYFLLILTIVVCISYIWVYAINTYDTWFRITGNGSGWISRYEQWTCRKIINNWVLDIFVPTLSNAEWDAFLDHTPTSITIEIWTWVCGQNAWTCQKGTPTWYSCQYWDAAWRCEDVCNVIEQISTSCTAQC